MSREDFLTKRLAERSTELERLRQGIQDYLDGNYANPRTYRDKSDGNGKCPHRRWWYEGCDECIDDHFAALLTTDPQALAGKRC